MSRIQEFLRKNPPKTFRAAPVYVPAGDYIVYFLKDVPHVSEHLNDVVTLYLDRESKELVGCKVKGVRHILDTAGAFTEAAALSGLALSAWVRERLRKVAKKELEEAGRKVEFLT